MPHGDGNVEGVNRSYDSGQRQWTHVVGGAVLPIQGLGDEHLAEHGVDIEHLVGRLISADARDAVADRDVLILVRADLNKNKPKSGDRSLRQSMHRSSVPLFFQTFSPRGGEGEGTNPNTFTVAKLHLKVLFYIQQPHL